MMSSMLVTVNRPIAGSTDDRIMRVSVSAVPLARQLATTSMAAPVTMKASARLKVGNQPVCT